jgi:hypothetical protein
MMLCQLGVDRGFFLVVHQHSNYMGLYSWANLQHHVAVGSPEGAEHSIKASLDTAKSDQHNVVVVQSDGSFYHVRFALQVRHS